MPDSNDELVGINEIAEMAGRSRQAVANWRVRHSDFPSPVVELAAGPVFRRSQIRSWLRKRRFPVAHVISTINLKGGVGKTTTTVAMAEFMSGVMGKRVLVIDLDPQTNATLMMIGEARWKEINAQEHTIARLFEDALDNNIKRFDFDATLQKGVSNVKDARTIDLLPSSWNLIRAQDQLASMRPDPFYAVTPNQLLERAVQSHLDDYDVVIIDCPPSLGLITQNGLRISDGFVIPTIPDFLSTYGIDQIKTQVEKFSTAIGKNIEPLGIVITKHRRQSNVHRNTVEWLRSKGSPPVFKTIIQEASNIAAAAEYGPERTLKQKWGYHPDLADSLEKLTKEVLSELEG